MHKKKEEMLFFTDVPRGVNVRATYGWDRHTGDMVGKDRTLHTINTKT
jgi:hypothetical protein